MTPRREAGGKPWMPVHWHGEISFHTARGDLKIASVKEFLQGAEK
jgi:hypothetical protein